jgi:hypothetical protein
MFIHRLRNLAIAAAALGLTCGQSAHAQFASTVYDPYVPGVQITPPLLPASQGAPPPVGCGPTPPLEVPGQQGPAALMPWVPSIPSNSIDQSFTGLSLPLGAAALTPPGVLGPALSGFIPPPSSAPGAIPAYLQSPGAPFNPADQVQVPAGGVLPGTGGYYTTINKVRRVGQKTDDYGFQGEPSIFGGGGLAQDSVTLMGPLAGFGVPYGIPTGVGYNNGPAGSNNDLYQSSVDLGGGQRMKIGGTTISTGQTLQDYGQNVFIGNGGPLSATQSSDYGQGWHGSGIFTNKTTDFGCKFQAWNPANVGVGDLNYPLSNGITRLTPPTAVETNF